MGGGNAQKTAMSRARNQAKADKEKGSGGGKSGMDGAQYLCALLKIYIFIFGNVARKGGNMSEAMAVAQAEREAVKKKREEKLVSLFFSFCTVNNDLFF
jgi:hypothetical protein